MNINKIVFVALAFIMCMGSVTCAADDVSTTITLTGTRNLISLPCVPLDPNPLSIFNGFSIHNNLTKWDIANQTDNVYNSAMPSAFGSAMIGEGYWLTGTAGDQIQYESLPSGVPDEGVLTDTWIPLPGADDDLNIGGRHMIGCPYDTSVPITNIQFTNGMEILSWPMANAAGWVTSSISYWTDSGYGYITCSGPSAVTVLQSGMGYWVQTNIDNIAMIITAPPSGYTLSSTVNLGDFDRAKCAAIPVNIQLRIGDETVRTVNTTLDADSKFYIDNVLPGEYYIAIKPSHWLRKLTGPVTVSDADVDFIIQ